MPREEDRSEQQKPPQQQQGQPERGFGRAPGPSDPAQGGSGERQQGGGGQSYQTDQPGQRAGRQRNGGQDSH
ncbi:MAG TPA: hypothetical protein VFI92_12545 [Steroidobacteraceae bacterium]|nr:hypothetical protein [Steroidobacteraceae bacterium]